MYGVLIVYFWFVDCDNGDGVFWLIFEIDFGNEFVVRECVEVVVDKTMKVVVDIVAVDTGLGRDEAELLFTALIGVV